MWGLWERRKAENKPKREKIDRYKDIMLRGKWLENRGMPVVISRGRLVDGIHRLTAIIESGVTLKIPVKYVH